MFFFALISFVVVFSFDRGQDCTGLFDIQPRFWCYNISTGLKVSSRGQEQWWHMYVDGAGQNSCQEYAVSTQQAPYKVIPLRPDH
jgi:hypothetical protein